MALSYGFEGRIVRVSLEGHYGLEDWFRLLDQALGDPACPEDAVLLCDMTRSAVAGRRQAADIRRSVEYMAHRAARFSSRVATFAAGDLLFGMIRMCASMLEGYGVEAMAFRTEGEAVGWLLHGEVPPAPSPFPA